MKKLTPYILFLLIGISIVAFSSVKVAAQSNEEAFRSEKYARAIGQIVDQSGGKFDREAVIQQLLQRNPQNNKENRDPKNPLDGLILTPTIDVVGYDGSESARFKYSPAGPPIPTLTYLENPNLMGSSRITNDSIIIDIEPNNSDEARLGRFIATAQFQGNAITDTAWILQEPQPQKLIYVSPNYLSVSPQGGITGNFIITYFNIDDWEAVIPDQNLDWISEISSTHNDSPDSISFLIEPNTGNTFREADIEIQDSNDPMIKDIIHIYQYGAQEQYLIASPTENYIEPGGGEIHVQVYSNITWNAAAINPPAEMITISPETSTGTGTLTITVTQNTTPEARTAQVKISGDDPLLSDTITIYQSAAYLLLSPGEKVLPASASTFGVDVIRYFVDNIIVEPDTTIWFTISKINNDSLSVKVYDNFSDTVRVAKVTVTSATNSSIGDTLNIFQYPANKPYIILSPTMQSAAWDQLEIPQPFTITSNNTGSLTATSTEPSWATPTLALVGDSVSVVLSKNTSTESRTAKIIVSDGSNSDVADSVSVIQGGAPTYIEISPKFHSVSFQGGNSGSFAVEAPDFVLWEIYFEGGKPDWINSVQIIDTTIYFTLVPNINNFTRQVTFKVRDVSNTARYDEAIILQEAAPVPYLFVSPREQAMAHTGNLMVDFVVTRVNVASWAFTDTLTLSEWINFFNVGDSILRLSIDTNFLPETRQASILIHATNDTLVTDTVSVYQYSAFDQYLLAAPREKVVDFPGDTIAFQITSVNVTDWVVDTISLPDWISEGEHTSDTMSLIIGRNDSIVSRSAIIKFFATDNPGIMDSVSVFQYAGQDAFLLAAPREQWAIHLNDTLTFDVTAVNVQAWSVDTTNTLPDWISVGSTTISQMILNIEPNNSTATRQAIVRLFVNDQPDIYDSVYVYQYSALDTFLLAAPREQWVAHTGNPSLDFDVTAVNVATWTANENIDWITVNQSGQDVLSLNVVEDTTLQTRMATVYINDSNSDAYDSVMVFQYSALDEYLLAAPREQDVFYTDTIINFDVTVVNIDQPWETEILSGNGWIQVLVSGDDSLQLVVSENDSLQTRFARIRIFASAYENVADTVTVYQFSAPDPLLLISPREQWVAHTGNLSLDFDVTAVNVATWTADVGNNGWITVNPSGQDVLSLNVVEDTTLQTRMATVYINDSNSDAYDSVMVYQYSSLDEYLLAAPREHEVLFTDTIVNFDITVVNVDDPWETEIISGNGWIEVLDSGNDLLQLGISDNGLLETRIGKVRIFAPTNPSAADTISVFQFSAPDTALLLAPREQWVLHTGNSNLGFQVTAVNVENWSANPGNFDWISVNPSGEELLSLNIIENTTLATRVGKVIISDDSNADVRDSVMVYQYSALDTFLLASPREQHVQFTGNTINFHITKVNVNSWVVNPDLLPYWIQLGANNEDTLNLNILPNTSLQTRYETIYLFGPDNPGTKDSVTVYQFAAVDPYILIAPREKRISHLGNATVDFDLTLVNVDEWEFVDTTIYQDWIDFQNLGNKMRLSIDVNNLLEARFANIVIRAVGDTLVKDSVSIYQYSALDKYILIEPREQLAKRYSTDTLYFEIKRVNVDSVAFEIFDDSAMINPDSTYISNDILTVAVKSNNSPYSRQASVKVFDPQSPDQVYDSVSVYQNFPYIILRPSATDSLNWSSETIKIETFSNVGRYTVSKDEAVGWYHISNDSVDWSNDSLVLAGNAEFYLRLDTNNNSYLRRSSSLKFKITNQIATEFWFDQNPFPEAFFEVTGKILIQNTNQPLQNVEVAIYDSIITTDLAGTYTHHKVLKNWIGKITPVIDSSWQIPYYFVPPWIEIVTPGIEGDTTLPTTFSAYPIQPAVEITPDSTSICFGQVLEQGSAGYPIAKITDTYGSSTYHWTAIPYDSVMAPDSNKLAPKFGPKVNTNYYLEVKNFYRTAVDSFKIGVNQLPEEFSFSGELTVCKNQAGVVYEVPNPQPGVYYQWQLNTVNPGGEFANSSFPYTVSGNIAIVNWGKSQGDYSLQLIAYNKFGCASDPVSKTIGITNSQAPEETTVIRKDNDNMLFCSDSVAQFYKWGWFVKNELGELEQEYIIPGKNDWYCRLPDGHTFDPSVYYYFVMAYFDENSCGSRSFYNAPVIIDELPDTRIGIFPNPGNGIFTIRYGDKLLNQEGVLEVYNVSGQMIFRRKPVALQNEEIIDLSGNRPGIYMITLRTSNDVFNAKIVIQ